MLTLAALVFVNRHKYPLDNPKKQALIVAESTLVVQALCMRLSACAFNLPFLTQTQATHPANKDSPPEAEAEALAKVSPAN